MSPRRAPIPLRFVRDVAFVFYLASVVAAVVVVLVLLPNARGFEVDIVARVASAAMAELVVVSFFRQLTPGSRPGVHRVEARGPYLRWLVSSALSDVALLGVVRWPFWFLDFTRGWYLRAIGVDLGLGAMVDAHVTLRQPELLSVGRAARIDRGVVIEGTIFGEGRIQVHRVAIGDAVLVSAGARLMPGAVVANEARVGADAWIGPHARVGFGASIGARAAIGEHADIGSYAVIGMHATIGDGVRIGERARVEPGASVPSNVVIEDRMCFRVDGTIEPMGRGASFVGA